jgi:hypothetical protein
MKKSVETGEELRDEKEVIVGWRGGGGADEELKMGMGKGEFPFGGHSKPPFAASNGARDKEALPILPDIGEEGFELAANAGEIGISRFWVNVGGDVNSVEAEGVRSWVNWEVMHVAESEVRVKGRCISTEGGCIKRET